MRMMVIVLAVALLALVAFALFAAAEFPSVLLCMLLPVSCVAAGFSAVAAVRPYGQATVLRRGQRVLGLLCVLTFMAFFSSAGDWVHMLWNVQYPMAGLFFGAGLILPQVWPDDRRRNPDLLCGWNGATVALLTLFVLGTMPILLALLPIDIHPVGRVSGSPLPALLEVARYGFDGTVPTLMQPEHPLQLARGLGDPPRFVTVTMGSTLLASGYWILFVAVALIGRLVKAGRPRSIFLACAPLVLAPVTVLRLAWGTFHEALWGNDPWLVRIYGPVLLLAAVATLVLLVAVRRDEPHE